MRLSLIELAAIAAGFRTEWLHLTTALLPATCRPIHFQPLKLEWLSWSTCQYTPFRPAQFLSLFLRHLVRIVMENNVADRIGLESAIRHAFGDDADVARLNLPLHASLNLTTLHRTQQRADAGFHADKLAAGDHSAGARNYLLDLVEVRMGNTGCGVRYFNVSPLNFGYT